MGLRPLDRNDNIYQRPLHEQDLTGLAELCATPPLIPSNRIWLMRCAWNGFGSASTARWTAVIRKRKVLEKANGRISSGNTCVDVDGVIVVRITTSEYLPISPMTLACPVCRAKRGHDCETSSTVRHRTIHITRVKAATKVDEDDREGQP
jgi:hypothetical protein